MHKSVQEDIHF